MNTNFLPLTAALLLVAAGTTVHAEDIGQHPAVFAPRALPGVDPSTFVVGHPASPTVRGGHANGQHPADAMAAREKQPGAVNPNTYVVQPPVAVHWVTTAS